MAFDEIETWIFDLDNTLYPAECNLFKQIDARMTAFIEQNLALPFGEARRLQKDYYAKYGTTMSGLMREHGVKPHDFMSYVHDIDLSDISPNNRLAQGIAALPGVKHIFTNGSRQHAENVTKKLGIADLFDDIFDIADAEFTPKPHRETYDRFIAQHGVDPKRAVMFEDLPDNLQAPHALGMTTVLIASNAEWIDDEPAEKRPAGPGETHAHVHHITDDLAHFINARIVPNGARLSSK